VDHESDDGVRVHRYTTGLRWEGSTGVGYDHYGRDHEVWVDPDIAPTTLSADDVFGGDPAKLSPERLIVLAASSCQALSFLAVAARARIDVVAYTDDATAEMPERRSEPSSIETITLRPVIHVRGEVAMDRVRRLVELAHRECYVANSLHTRITVEPEIVFVDGSSS
jgi:organic hydroperoxide reductase OsmC/OhrA